MEYIVVDNGLISELRSQVTPGQHLNNCLAAKRMYLDSVGAGNLSEREVRRMRVAAENAETLARAVMMTEGAAMGLPRGRVAGRK